jgi:hypothetical protein
MDTPSLQHVVMENDFMKVSFSKYALEGTVELSGATLQLFSASPDEDVDATEEKASEGLQDVTEASEGVPGPTDEGRGEDTAPEPLFEWTTTDGPYLLERIEAGDYILHEASPPEGYVSAEDIAVTVVETGEVQRVVLYDDHTKVVVSKLSAQTSGPLAGAVLQVFVYREPDEALTDDTGTEGEDDTTDGKDGDSEWQALEGADEAEDDSVDEGVENDTEADGPASDGSVEDGATDDVSGDDGQPQVLEPLYEWTTTGEPYLIEYLPIGTYVLHEASAPQGYLVSEDMVFVVRDSGEVQSVVLYDEPVQVGFWDRTGVDFPFSVLVIAVLAVVALTGVIDVAFSACRTRRARKDEAGPSGGSDASVEE